MRRFDQAMVDAAVEAFRVQVAAREAEPDDDERAEILWAAIVQTGDFYRRTFTDGEIATIMGLAGV